MGQPDRFASAYRQVWRAFTAASTTTDGRHDTERWRQHGGPYAACVIRVDATSLTPALATFRHALAPLPEIRLNPDGFLHVMVQELGFVVDYPSTPDEISLARLEEFAIAAIEPIAATPPFLLSFGGANAFQDAVFLEVAPAKILSRLHTRLFDLAALPLSSQFSYLPHCTIAHYTGVMPTAMAVEVIAPWREHLFGRLSVRELEIVTFDTSQVYPPLATYAAIPLGG